MNLRLRALRRLRHERFFLDFPVRFLGLDFLEPELRPDVVVVVIAGDFMSIQSKPLLSMYCLAEAKVPKFDPEFVFIRQSGMGGSQAAHG